MTFNGKSNFARLSFKPEPDVSSNHESLGACELRNDGFT